MIDQEDYETIILDNTHLDKEFVLHLLEIIGRRPAEFVFITIPPDVSLLKHVERNKHGVSFSEMMKQDEDYRLSRIRFKIEFKVNMTEVSNVVFLTDEEVKQIIESLRFERPWFYYSWLLFTV